MGFDENTQPERARALDQVAQRRVVERLGDQEDGIGARGARLDELVLIDEALRRLIHDRAGEPILREACGCMGVRSLGEDGARWVVDGTTSLAELLRVTGASA